MTLIEFYKQRFAFKDEMYWRHLIEIGDTSVNRQGVASDYVLKEKDLLHTVRRDVQEPDVNDHYKILHDQNGILVINKPAPLPVHPAGRFFKNSLTEILKEKFPDKTIHTIHRLDLWTTGVLLLATEEESAKFLHRQMEDGKIKKIYGVLARGDFGDKPFVIDRAIGRKNGAHRGFGDDIRESKPCVTEFIPLVKIKRNNEDITFLEAKPLTGRTNQIRVHIQAAGGEILNDPLYSKNPPKEEDIAFIGLHCREMRFMEPSGKILQIQAEWPEGFRPYLQEEGGQVFLQDEEVSLPSFPDRYRY